MNLKKTILLSLILLVASWYIVKVELPEDAQSAKQEAPFAGLKPEHVSKIVITNQHGEIQLVNSKAVPAPATAEAKVEDDAPLSVSAAGWELAGISGSQIDDNVLRGIFTGLASLKVGKALPAEEVVGDGSAFGLKEPSAKVAVTRAGESSATEVQFGKMNEYLSERYLRIGGSSDTFLARESVVNQLDRKASAFRDQTPIQFVDGDIQAITLTSKAGTFKLAVDGGGTWRLLEPMAVRAADEVVAELSRDIRNLRAEDFVDTADRAKAAFGLDVPAVTIRVEFRAEEKRAPLEVVLGAPVSQQGDTKESKDKPAAKVFMTVSGLSSWYRLMTDPGTRFHKTLDQLREKEQFTVNTSRLATLTVEGQGRETITIKKDGESFTVNGQPGDDPFVREYLRTITTSQAKGFAAANTLDPAAPHYAKISMQLVPLTEEEKVKPEAHTLVIGSVVAKDSADRYASVVGSGEVMVYPGEVVEKLLPRLESLKKVEPTPTVAPSPATPG